MKNTTMKNLTKLLASALFAVAILFGTNVKAQTITPNKFRFGLGVEGGIVTGDAHDFSNLELGGTARVQYGLTPTVALTLTSGYYNFFGKTVPGLNEKYQSLGMVPIKAGVKYFFTQNLYLAGEAGVGIETKTFAYQGEPDNLDSQTNTKLLLTPGIGYANKHWDVGVRYENYSGQDVNYGIVGLRVAYGFGL
ncbi:outer membrane beta-barrel protein [Mucilaginibacter sp. BJC16-A38]|uniref:outer membrane beta-barrel protein n=1 Tax=Mucilaginibacter phenanthrenivorans TaxID=1234842 RepID=UPI0021572EBE|nr:outer membrane beta-barrel protein [Mucilaginibacter phenanthrenivorans]MCR8556224.1 outer membrane beta-barrel protein [Mucilaginibacter phenanthrenivorans]